MTHASHAFPPGYSYAFPQDSTAFIKLSVEEVVKTLAEAIVLVVIVMFVFLQSWRATLIPAIAVPVVLLGTFGILALFGYSINTLTLFGLVLSIGLLVDDAIVVVENVERVMEEEDGITPRDATIKSMAEIQTALIGIALVLSAVFMPMAFFGGSVGVIYRQFAITIISSMVLSVLVALILSPALASHLLKRPDHRDEGRVRARSATVQRLVQPHRRPLSARPVKRIIATPLLFLIGYGVIVAVLIAGFPPPADRASCRTRTRASPSSSSSCPPARRRRARRRSRNRSRIISPGPRRASSASSISSLARTTRAAARMSRAASSASRRWDQRTEARARTPRRSSPRTNKKLTILRDAQFTALNPVAGARHRPVGGFHHGARERRRPRPRDVPPADRRARRGGQGDPVADRGPAERPRRRADAQPSTSMPSRPARSASRRPTSTRRSPRRGAALYVNDFIDRGRVKRVYIQGDAPFRSKPEDLSNWYVRNASGTMTPFSTFAHTRWQRTPTTLQRYNAHPSFEIAGEAAPGSSSGAAMATMTDLAAKQPGTAVEWSALSYQERLSGGQTPLLYSLSILVVFLCLAALYESWSVPFSVLLVIPLGLVGATLAVTLRGLTNDVYFQVGLLTTMGLSAKNAILIVEFAEQAEKAGKSALDAALEAARLRLRPIIMTSLAFIFGVIPLAISTGAGAQSRIAIGTAVVGGMLTATLLAIFYVPLAFVLVRKRVQAGTRRTHAGSDHPVDDAPRPGAPFPHLPPDRTLLDGPA